MLNEAVDSPAKTTFSHTPSRVLRFVLAPGLRDSMMAENLEYIISRERGRGKVLAFAHNSHLRRSKAEWQLGPHHLRWWPAGAHLAEIFGPRYAAIGTAVGVSEENGIGDLDDFDALAFLGDVVYSRDGPVLP